MMAILAAYAMERNEPGLQPFTSPEGSNSGRWAFAEGYPAGRCLRKGGTYNSGAGAFAYFALPGQHEALHLSFHAKGPFRLAFDGSNAVEQASFSRLSTSTFSVGITGRTLPTAILLGLQNEWAHYKVKFLQASVGEFSMWQNGVLVYQYLGNTLRSSNAAPVVSVSFRAPNETGDTDPAWLDNLVIADDEIPEIFVDYLRPDGNGADSDWAGSDGNSTDNYLLVNDPDADGTTHVRADATDLNDSYTMSNLALGRGVVLGVRPEILVKKEGPGDVLPLELTLTEGGSTSRGGVAGVGMDFGGVGAAYVNTKPSGGDWTLAAANNLEVGLSTDD